MGTLFPGSVCVCVGVCVCVARGGGGGGPPPRLVGCVESRELGANRFPRFILLGNFSDTFLMVSILDIVCDCHLLPLLQS